MKMKKTYKLRAAGYYCNGKRYTQGDIFETEENSSIKAMVHLRMLQEMPSLTKEQEEKKAKSEEEAIKRGSKMNVPKSKFINEDLKPKKKSKKDKKEKPNLDFNGDGKFDEKDVSLGAQAMAKAKELKKEE